MWTVCCTSTEGCWCSYSRVKEEAHWIAIKSHTFSASLNISLHCDVKNMIDMQLSIPRGDLGRPSSVIHRCTIRWWLIWGIFSVGRKTLWNSYQGISTWPTLFALSGMHIQYIFYLARFLAAVELILVNVMTFLFLFIYKIWYNHDNISLSEARI